MDQSFLVDKQAAELRRLKARNRAVLIAVSAIALVGVAVGAGKALLALGQAHKSSAAKIGMVHDVKNAPFNFLVPGANDAWSYDAHSLEFDPDKGVMKYSVKMNYASADVTISQQVMPPELKGGQQSQKFMGFIQSSNVVRSQQAGAGMVYYIAMMQNGAQANGADAVIYATDDILLFGRTGSMLGYDAWANLMASMKTQASK